MISLKEALIIKLKDKTPSNWYSNTNEELSKIAIYNAALDDTLTFIYLFENGNVSDEYLNELKKQQG
jgi:hypothetical protein|tara:strand:+ start:1093 stop:1293 length:201 start_codon:yes stop_codon:yes gene_type:complete